MCNCSVNYLTLSKTQRKQWRHSGGGGDGGGGAYAAGLPRRDGGGGVSGGGTEDGKHADKSCAGLIRGCCFYVCVVL